MPFTLYHLGPAILVGLILFPLLDLPTFVVANIIIDLEPLLVLLLGLRFPLHGPLHSLTLGALAAAGLTLVMPGLSNLVKPFLRSLRLHHTSRFNRVLASSLLGVWLHIVLDALIYPEVRLLYPIRGNQLLGLASPGAVYVFCSAALPLALLVHLVRFLVLRSGRRG